MLNYAIVEIAGRQYLVSPKKVVKVDHLGDLTNFDCDKVLAISTGDKLEIGRPYLKTKLGFEVLGKVRAKKTRVARFTAKSNTRRVVGSRNTYSTVMLKEG